MTEFRRGDKVTVKSYEGTVLSAGVNVGLRLGVEDADGYVHYYGSKMLEKHLPYEDGQKYLSATGTIFIFRAEAGTGGYWQVPGHHLRHTLGSPMRPMRRVDVGPQIEE